MLRQLSLKALKCHQGEDTAASLSLDELVGQWNFGMKRWIDLKLLQAQGSATHRLKLKQHGQSGQASPGYSDDLKLLKFEQDHSPHTLFTGDGRGVHYGGCAPLSLTGANTARRRRTAEVLPLTVTSRSLSLLLSLLSLHVAMPAST